MYPDHIKTVFRDCKDMSVDAYFNVMAQKNVNDDDKLLFMKQEIIVEEAPLIEFAQLYKIYLLTIKTSNIKRIIV